MSIDWDGKVIAPTSQKFGERITFYPKNAASFSIEDGVFDEQYQDVRTDNGEGITSQMPVLGVRDAECPQLLKQGDELVRAKTGERYVVKETQPDGHGHNLLKLNSLNEARTTKLR